MKSLEIPELDPDRYRILARSIAVGQSLGHDEETATYWLDLFATSRFRPLARSATTGEQPVQDQEEAQQNQAESDQGQGSKVHQVSVKRS